MSATTVFVGVLWAITGALCGVFSDRRGVAVAFVLPLVVSLFPFLFWVNPPDSPSPTFQWFRFGHEFSGYLDHGIVPVAASVLGAVAALWALPVVEEEERKG